MERHFHHSLDDLKTLILAMAHAVQQAIDLAIEALEKKDAKLIERVHQLEEEINRDHIQVDEHCLKLLALQQPLAADLRLIVAIIKINTDLERMGDQAVNIALNSQEYLSGKPLKPLVDLPIMFKEVKAIVQEAIDSFVQRDEKLAREVLNRDDRIDALKNKIFRSVVEALKNSPDGMEQGLSLILIARNLERIGDHATNIAEDVIFAVSGEDVRHGNKADSFKPALS